MSNFALLWGKILESSLWIQGSKETRLVWITILAMKDADGIVQASVVGLADRAKVAPDECREALRVLLAPDPEDTSKVEEGRRLREVEGGWQVVNHELYRYSTEAKRAFWREQKALQRERKAAKKKGRGKPTAAEVAWTKAVERGDQEGADRIMEASLPAAARGGQGNGVLEEAEPGAGPGQGEEDQCAPAEYLEPETRQILEELQPPAESGTEGTQFPEVG